jgi:hypothetical protein
MTGKQTRILARRHLPTLLLGTLACACGCKKGEEGTQDMRPSGAALRITSVKTRAQVAELMAAAIQMQVAGEPLAEAMGRDLAGFDRYALPADRYTDPETKKEEADLVGYSTAVESYEYSKFAMNSLSFESGAGLSLMYGPLLNPSGQGGAAALGLLRDRVQKLALASRAGADENGPWVKVPPPRDNPMNLLGFPGLAPQFAEFRSFDPTINPSGNVAAKCSLEGGYGASAGTTQTVGDYECGYNTLHLASRDTQVERVLSPDALGLSTWKQALWTINYLEIVHDTEGGQFNQVAEADLGKVGQPGNTVVAKDDQGTSGKPGTYLGAGDLEGFQALLLIDEVLNKAALLLQRLTTTDGKALSGFASLKEALDYDYNAPVRFFPHEVSVTERPGTEGADAQPTGFAVMNGESRLADLSALLGGYADFFALTDRDNADIGGAATVRPVFDGDPFPTDNGKPDGENTPHDRTLALIKVALVNLDRLHRDPATGVLCTAARVGTGGVERTRRASTVEMAEGLVALRTAYRALTSQLTLYSNTTPDRAATTTRLDGTSMAGAPAEGGGTVAARLSALIKAQAEFLRDKLMDAEGLAKNGYDLAGGQPDGGQTTLEAQAALVHGLLSAYLSTSDVSFRAAAERAHGALQARFYHGELRLYRHVLGEEQAFVYTPRRFGLLQAALRDTYLLIAQAPGKEALKTEIEARIARMNKLVLNGWDDADGDGVVAYPAECMRVEAALPRGGLQLAERALTGELGSQSGALTSDRERDCVPEIDDAHLPAHLGAEVRIERR